jgi:hypothetical protein
VFLHLKKTKRFALRNFRTLSVAQCNVRMIFKCSDSHRDWCFRREHTR